MMLEPEREIGFLDLARDRALVGEEQVLGELLGDRGAALAHAARGGVDRQRAQSADHVDAEMAEETAVLGRQHGLDEMVGQFLERDRVVVLDAAPADFDAVAIEEGDGEIAALEPVLVGGFAIGGQREGDDDDEADEAEVEPLADEIERHFADAEQPQPLRGLRDRLPGGERPALAVVHGRIDGGVDAEQRAAHRLPKTRPFSFLRRHGVEPSASVLP